MTLTTLWWVPLEPLALFVSVSCLFPFGSVSLLSESSSLLLVQLSDFIWGLLL